MTENPKGLVSVPRQINAPIGKVFELLVDPQRHTAMDGSGMLRGAVPGTTITGVGDTFIMKMHNDHMGDYEITNFVVEYQPERRVGWEPSLTKPSRPEGQDRTGERLKHGWSFALEPLGPDVTLVTETYDCTNAPHHLRQAVKEG